MTSIAEDDQRRAAQAEAQAIIETFSEITGGAVIQSNGNAWIDSLFEGAAEHAKAGRLVICGHLAKSANPMPAFVAAWRTQVVVCMACSGELAAPGSENFKCDRCRETPEVLNVGMVRTGALTLTFGICPACSVEAKVPFSPQR